MVFVSVVLQELVQVKPKCLALKTFQKIQRDEQMQLLATINGQLNALSCSVNHNSHFLKLVKLFKLAMQSHFLVDTHYFALVTS